MLLVVVFIQCRSADANVVVACVVHTQCMAGKLIQMMKSKAYLRLKWYRPGDGLFLLLS